MAGFCSDKSLKSRAWTLKGGASVEGTPEGVPEVAARLAADRGFDLAQFFSPTLKASMPDPSALKGMDDAVAAFCDAVEGGKRIALYGDYDVDGATSTALVLRWIRAVGHDAIFYIPDRMREGYGPNAESIRRMHAEEGIEFLLLLDSGTTAHVPLAAAVELGLGIAILDHHEPDDRDPPGILVNPKRRDEDRSLDYLCTAGLAFLFLVGVQREMRGRGFFTDARPAPDLRRWLGIVALGTVADVVPLRGLNRAYVTAGLPRMGEVPGIEALTRVTGEPNFTAKTCGFVFGPCINATGRIGDTRLGTMLLATDDQAEADFIARDLVETNKERREIQQTAVDAALVEALERKGDDVVVLSNPSWHPGVVGLVASRVKDLTDRPAVIVGAGGTASCRSVEGFDLGSAVIAAREAGILVKGGGHAMAAGLTVLPERLEDLRAFLCERAKGFKHPPVTIDLAVPCGELDAAMVEAFSLFEPCGAGNPLPRVVVTGGWVKRTLVMKGVHLKIWLAGPGGETQAVMWRAIGSPVGDALVGSEGRFVDVLGSAKVDSYAGRSSAVVTIEDAMVGGYLDEAEAA